MLKLIFSFCLVFAFSYGQSLISNPVNLPNSSYRITGITYIQNTNWVQIAICSPGSGGFMRLYDFSQTPAILLQEQLILNKSNTFTSNLINLPNSYFVSATVVPNYTVSNTFLSIWNAQGFAQVNTINNVGHVECPWINDKVILIADNSSIYSWNVATDTLISTIPTEFEEIYVIEAASNSTTVTGKKAYYPDYYFIDVIDSFTHSKRYSFNYSVPVVSMSTLFRSYQSQRYFSSQVLIVWGPQDGATNNLFMILDTSNGEFTNITNPTNEVIQQCWGADAYNATFICQTHSAFLYFKDFTYVRSQPTTEYISDIAFHVEDSKFYFAYTSSIEVWNFEEEEAIFKK